ncbi:type II secretion system protein E [Sulfurimonas gotlandica GD1]|uniref:Type II secretion system protein E n=1 Tax=Sulfurimonas gotlandica (strain DSM 19862 / JCM 16533 / GD1) TaxID=929558 RepID=B6BMR9_SULGG|nr:GspE/PulE family protein [Sulfurimonas gotlandica]EDZ61518.1 type II secretion system protein E [Sulfurimonas gotlandica GD1]EHP30814.1 type II secretion system protein E [Sulfurimonas gotlandica GD1]
MDRITNDLLANGSIMQGQVDRLLSKGLSSDLILRDITLSGFMTMDRLIRFIVEQIRNGVYELSIIDNYDYIDEKEVLQKLSKDLELSFLDLDAIDMDYHLTSQVPLAQLKRYLSLPISQDDMYVTIAFSDPLNIEAQEAIQRLFPRKIVKIATASKKQIQSYLFKVELKDSVKGLVKKIRDELNSINSIEEQQEASSILLLIDVILKACIRGRASDIHIEPTEKNCVVRARVDGKLAEIFIFEKDIYPPLASRLKLLANLDIAEKRKPQDGRFSTAVGTREFDFRISTLPILYGESIVMRILDKEKALVKLEDAGMDTLSYNKLLKGLKEPFGIILVTGPTGSGKTTTLYGALNELRNVEDKVITVEDPVEYRMNLIQQVQVNQKVGLSFADALRSILRQDPDKIMIGEIRDQETLEIAIKAALTGHMVISTLHTNDSISAIPRMVDMGIENYLISGALVAIQAQRLVRKICSKCKAVEKVPASILEELEKFIPENAIFYHGQGCKECNDTGYMGREMICEVLNVTEELSSLIAKGAPKDAMLSQAIKDGFVGIFENGIQKALDGVTSIEEVLRVAKG